MENNVALDFEALKTSITGTPTNARGYRVFPPKLRAQIISYATHRQATGATWRTIGEELGIGDSTLAKWCKKPSPPTSGAFREVQVTPRPLTLRGPWGVQLEGSPSDLAAVLKALWSSAAPGR